MNDYRILKGGECASVAGAGEDPLLDILIVFQEIMSGAHNVPNLLLGLYVVMLISRQLCCGL